MTFYKDKTPAKPLHSRRIDDTESKRSPFGLSNNAEMRRLYDERGVPEFYRKQEVLRRGKQVAKRAAFPTGFYKS